MRNGHDIRETLPFNTAFTGCIKSSMKAKALLWLLLIASISVYGAPKKKPLMIREQGSFAVGGTVITNPGTFNPYKQTPEGQTFHGVHAYVFYQVPAKARKYPLVMWHGIGHFSKTWKTTPYGREGFQNIFLRRRFPVFLIDQPRREYHESTK